MEVSAQPGMASQLTAKDSGDIWKLTKAVSQIILLVVPCIGLVLTAQLQNQVERRYIKFSRSNHSTNSFTSRTQHGLQISSLWASDPQKPSSPAIQSDALHIVPYTIKIIRCTQLPHMQALATAHVTLSKHLTKPKIFANLYCGRCRFSDPSKTLM